MINIPGDILEGGGQILRISVALSAITNKPVRITNIRVKRSSPGLKAQHLNAVKAVAMLSNAQVDGLKIGSKEIVFNPRQIKGGSFNIEVGTAGSTSLILQALMPVTSFSTDNVCLTIRGGTNNPKAPPTEYIQEVVLPTIKKMGVKGSVTLARRGFYPKGDGRIESEFEPSSQICPIQLTEFGEVIDIFGLSYSSRLKSHIVERIASSAKNTLIKNGYEKIRIDLEPLEPRHYKCAIDPGCGIVLFAKLSSGSILGSNNLGEIGKPAEKVGKEAATELIKELNKKAPI
ncbi:MAG: RNA 3'-terminal phosphate cyclase, partial [Candidatus Thorarchaeota archaeon]